MKNRYSHLIIFVLFVICLFLYSSGRIMEANRLVRNIMKSFGRIMIQLLR